MNTTNENLPPVPAARIIRNGITHAQVSTETLDKVYAQLDNAMDLCRQIAVAKHSPAIAQTAERALREIAGALRALGNAEHGRA